MVGVWAGVRESHTQVALLCLPACPQRQGRRRDD